MDKKAVLLQNIKRLIDLGVQDKDIVTNLGDVGIPLQESVSLLAEAKAGLSSETVVAPEPAQAFPSSRRESFRGAAAEGPKPRVEDIDFGAPLREGREKESPVLTDEDFEKSSSSAGTAASFEKPKEPILGTANTSPQRQASSSGLQRQASPAGMQKQAVAIPQKQEQDAV